MTSASSRLAGATVTSIHWPASWIAPSCQAVFGSRSMAIPASNFGRLSTTVDAVAPVSFRATPLAGVEGVADAAAEDGTVLPLGTTDGTTAAASPVGPAPEPRSTLPPTTRAPTSTPTTATPRTQPGKPP